MTDSDSLCHSCIAVLREAVKVVFFLSIRCLLSKHAYFCAHLLLFCFVVTNAVYVTVSLNHCPQAMQ